jgi:hypothetical protein
MDKPESADIAWRELLHPDPAYERAQNEANLELERIVAALDMPSLNMGWRFAIATTPAWSHPNSHALPFGPVCLVRHEMLPDGSLFIQEMLAGSFGSKNARDFAMAFATAHEAAHCSFARIDGAGSSTTARSTIGSALKPKEADQAALWLAKTWNESYADIVAMAYAAQRFPPEIFNAGISALMGKRVAGHLDSLGQARLAAPNGFSLNFDSLDTHATQFAISAALRLGQNKLATLKGRELERLALSASLESTAAGMLSERGALGYLKHERSSALDFADLARIEPACLSCRQASDPAPSRSP